MSARALARFKAFRAGQLGGLASDSLYVGLWQASASIADLLQIVLLTHALGLTEYGRFALLIAFVTLVGQFFDVRMTTATTAFAARWIRSDLRAAAGIFQFSYLVDALTGIVGFAVVVSLAPIVGPHLVGADGTQLTMLFALTLLIGTVDDTSITIMRLLDRFRLAAVYGAASELLRVLLIWAALAWSKSLSLVLGALVAYCAIRAAINFLAARQAYRGASGGVGLFEPRLAGKSERREMFSMIAHTNIASYARLAMTQLPTVLVGAISGATQVGVYKVGMAVAAAVGRLGDPAMSAIFPRVARLWSAGKHNEVKRLIQHATILAVGIMGAAAALTIAFRRPIVDLVTGDLYVAGVGAVIVLGALGHAINGVLFWNGQVLFAAGRARLVATVLLVGAAVQVAFVATFVPSYGAKGAALAFLVAQLVINTGLTVAVVRLLSRRSSPEADGGAVKAQIDLPIERVAPR